MLELLFLVIAVTCIWSAFFVARQVQKWIDIQNRKGRNGEADLGGWIGHIHGIWYVITAAFGALKYVYKAWVAAPNGSFAKFGWFSLLAIITSIILMAIIKIVDKKLNSDKTHMSTSIADTNEQDKFNSR